MRLFQEAVEWADLSLNHEPNFTPVLRIKLVACAQLDRVDEALAIEPHLDSA